MWVNLNSLPDRANGSNDCPSRVGLIFNLKMLLLQTQREQNVNIKVNEAVKTSTLIIFKFVYTCIHKCWYLRSRKNWMNENCLCRMRKRDVLFCINKIHFIFIFFFIYSKQVEMSTCEFFIILQLNYLNLLLFSQAADGKTECNLHQFLRPVNVHCTAKWDNNILSISCLFSIAASSVAQVSHCLHKTTRLMSVCVLSFLRLSMENVLSAFNKHVNELMSTKVWGKNQSGLYCLHSKSSFLMIGFFLCLQCSKNIPLVVTNVRVISNLLSGLTCHELEDAIGALNRISHVNMVGICYTFARHVLAVIMLRVEGKMDAAINRVLLEENLLGLIFSEQYYTSQPKSLRCFCLFLL